MSIDLDSIRGGGTYLQLGGGGGGQDIDILPSAGGKNFVAFIFQLSGWALVAPSCFVLLYSRCTRIAGPGAAMCFSNFAHERITYVHGYTTVQKFALRVCSKQWDTNYHTLLARYNIPSLFNRRQLLRLCFLFNVLNGSYLQST